MSDAMRADVSPAATVTDRPTIHEPGVYFGMKMSEYLADRSLSSSGCKDLVVGPANYWRNSPMNPEREQKESAALEYGTALHKRLLEGAEAFAESYAVRLSKEDYPDALDTMADLRAFAAGLGIKGSSKEELCDRIVARGAIVELWPVIEREHREANEGKTFIDTGTVERIEAAVAAAMSHEDLRRALVNGIPEVSIFWTDDEFDVPLKTRIDLLKPKAILELKSFSNGKRLPVDKAVGSAMAGFNYGVQAVIQMEAIETLKGMLQRGDAKVSGDHDPAWLRSLATSPEHRLVFAFLESCAYPAIRVREFRRLDDLGGETGYWTKAHRDFRQAVETFANCRAAHGSKPWTDAPAMSPFNEEDFPQWARGPEDTDDASDIHINGEAVE